VDEVKSSESYVGSDFELELEKGIHIIDEEPSATVPPTNIHTGEPDESEEGENLFHSKMWVKGTLIHFIVESGS
jgi:hypothetical protein